MGSTTTLWNLDVGNHGTASAPLADSNARQWIRIQGFRLEVPCSNAAACSRSWHPPRTMPNGWGADSPGRHTPGQLLENEKTTSCTAETTTARRDSGRRDGRGDQKGPKTDPFWAGSINLSRRGRSGRQTRTRRRDRRARHSALRGQDTAPGLPRQNDLLAEVGTTTRSSASGVASSRCAG